MTATATDTAAALEQSDYSSIDEGLEGVRGKMLHLLETTPYITRAMLQVGLGPALPPKIWSPILDGLLKEERVLLKSINTATSTGRAQVKEIYHLPAFPYPPVSNKDLANLYKID